MVTGFREAGDHASAALAVFDRETDPQGLHVTYPLYAQAVSRIGTGHFEIALPLRGRRDQQVARRKRPVARRRVR